MPEYSPELRAKVDALRESVNDAGRPYVERMGALFSLANAIAPYTAHIDAQAERIAELEAENARLRELMADVDSISDAIDESFDADWTSRDGAQHVVWWFEAENARAALKDTAQ